MANVFKVLAVLVAVAAGALAAVLGYYSFSESRLADKFEDLPVGSSKQLVLERFGQPAAVSSDCYVSQHIEYEAPARWSVDGRVSSCAFWFGPTARSYVVGFTSTGEVIGVAYGDS